MIDYKLEGLFENIIYKITGDFNGYYNINAFVTNLSDDVITILDISKSIINHTDFPDNLSEYIDKLNTRQFPLFHLFYDENQGLKLIGSVIDRAKFREARNRVRNIFDNVCPSSTRGLTDYVASMSIAQAIYESFNENERLSVTHFIK